jgi:hypothetical protein
MNSEQEGLARQEALEAMIDASSVHHVLALIAGICLEKADHIQANWQDAPLAVPVLASRATRQRAQEWAHVSSRIDSAASYARNRSI